MLLGLGDAPDHPGPLHGEAGQQPDLSHGSQCGEKTKHLKFTSRQVRHYILSGPNMSDLCSDDAEVRTSLVKINIEQWEGGDHDETRHTKVDKKNVTRGPESSISGKYSHSQDYYIN